MGRIVNLVRREGDRMGLRGVLAVAGLWAAVCTVPAAAEEAGDLTPGFQSDSISVEVSPELYGPIQAMQAGDYAAAAEELHELVGRDSSHVQALRLLASASIHLDAYAQAIRMCRRISVLDSTDVGVVVALGFLYQIQGDFDLAEMYYRQALKRDPNMIQAYQGLGWTYLQRRRLEQALDMVTRTSERAPDYAPNYLLMGRVLTAQGFFENAAVAYGRAFALRPELREQYGILLQELALRHRLVR